MRTYTRNKLIHHEIEGVHELCRLCLEKPEVPLPLFTEDPDSQISALALRVMICVGLEMTKHDCLPNLICTPCHQELEKYYSFRKKCEVSYKKLKSHMLAVKEKEAYIEAERMRQEDQLNVVKTIDNGNVKQNIIFTVNVDGSFQFCESKNTLNSESFLTLMKLEPAILKRNVPIVLNSDILESTETQSRNDQAVIEKSLVLTDNNVVQIVKSAESPPQPNTVVQKGSPDMDLSSFLPSMLVELGTIAQDGDHVELVAETRTVEMETGDGTQITFELIEEDEQMDESSDAPPVKEAENGTEENCPINNDGMVRARAWCATCRKALGSRSVLARHVRDVHARERPHACARCHKRFAQRSVLRRHMLTHDVKRPFQCAECPKSFTQRSALEAHRRAHTPPDVRALNLFRCARCPKVFLYSSGLSRHMLTHSGKKFYCICERAFHDRSSLLRHMRLLRHGQLEAAGRPRGGEGGDGT